MQVVFKYPLCPDYRSFVMPRFKMTAGMLLFDEAENAGQGSVCRDQNSAIP